MEEAKAGCDGGGADQSLCPTCDTRATSVSTVTLYHLLEPLNARDVQYDKIYSVCQTRSCPILYFSSDHKQTFESSDARTIVGFKQPENESPHPVCYCFGYTRENIADEITETGDSTVVEWITERVQAEECACEYRNPTGRCCLGDVREAVKKASK
jgi:hypothetical protein